MSRLLSLAFATSTLLHGVAYASLGLAPRSERREARASTVVFETVAAERAVVVREPPKPPPPEVGRILREPLARPSSPQAPAPAVEPQTAPLDLSGLTLTHSDGSGDFAMPAGDGRPRTGPIRAVAPKSAASQSPAPPRPDRSREPELVASTDLSKRPEPPRLDEVLRGLYPDEARRRGISGNASLRVRIGADGRVRTASLLTESFPGFGEACRKAVIGSSWSPPHDGDGRRVETEVRYTCRFVVD